MARLLDEEGAGKEALAESSPRASPRAIGGPRARPGEEGGAWGGGGSSRGHADRGDARELGGVKELH